MSKFKLGRTKQCITCPFRAGSTVADIPNYNSELHEGLIKTIANGEISLCPANAMSCHYSKEGADEYCIGWLHNQLGAGNNIGLRLKMLNCENIRDVEVIGEQVERFGDTFK